MILQCSWFVSFAAAHPASGIVVDNEGRVFFIHSGHAVMKIDGQGKLQAIHQIKDGHWMALDTHGACPAGYGVEGPVAGSAFVECPARPG
jgi:hypothetical protein